MPTILLLASFLSSCCWLLFSFQTNPSAARENLEHFGFCFRFFTKLWRVVVKVARCSQNKHPSKVESRDAYVRNALGHLLMWRTARFIYLFLVWRKNNLKRKMNFWAQVLGHIYSRNLMWMHIYDTKLTRWWCVANVAPTQHLHGTHEHIGNSHVHMFPLVRHVPHGNKFYS